MIIVLAVTVVVLAYAVGALYVRLDRVTQALRLLIEAHNISMEAVKLIATADTANLQALSRAVTTMGADVAELSQRMENR